MSWRSGVSILLGFIGGLGPAVVLLFLYGPRATLGSASANEVSLTLHLVGLMLISLVCGLVAGALARGDARGQIRAVLKSLSRMQQRSA